MVSGRSGVVGPPVMSPVPEVSRIDTDSAQRLPMVVQIVKELLMSI